MKQVCFFMGLVAGLIAYRSFGMTGVVMLGTSDALLFIADKVWGD